MYVLVHWSTTPEAPGSNLGKETKIFQYFFSCSDTFDFKHIFSFKLIFRGGIAYTYF